MFWKSWGCLSFIVLQRGSLQIITTVKAATKLKPRKTDGYNFVGLQSRVGIHRRSEAIALKQV
jgi:hypothetical protein